MGCNSSKLVSNQQIKRKEVAALIVIDVQNDFCAGGSLCVPDHEAILPIIEKIRTEQAYKERYQHVYFTRDWKP